MKKIIILFACILSTSAFAQKANEEAYAEYVSRNADAILEQIHQKRTADEASKGYTLEISDFDESFNGNNQLVYHLIESNLARYGEKLCEINPTSIKKGEVIGDAAGETIWCNTGEEKIAVSLYFEASSKKIYAYLFHPNAKESFAKATVVNNDGDYLAEKESQRKQEKLDSKARYEERQMSYHPVFLNY